MYTNEQISTAITKALEDKGKRKFTQSLEMAVNFRNIDFAKTDNRLNIEVSLPKGRGKDVQVVVFADGALATEAKEAGADLIISGDDIAGYDKGKIKKMTSNSQFFAQPQLMMQVGKNFGQILGGRGKLPKPLAGNVSGMLKASRNTLKLRTRGKNLPTVHCAVGTEKMSVEDLVINISSVLESLRERYSDQNIGSVYLKLSMGKSVLIV